LFILGGLYKASKLRLNFQNYGRIPLKLTIDFEV